jgi:hypothetical protein
MRAFAIAAFFFILLPEICDAQGLCFQACNSWCNRNRPVSTCYADCQGRPMCQPKLGRSACYQWCAANKPGNVGCQDDCAWRPENLQDLQQPAR